MGPSGANGPSGVANYLTCFAMLRLTSLSLRVALPVSMKGLFVRFVREDQGQDLIEYALLATVIALAVFVGASAAGTSLNTWYTNIGATVTKWAANAIK